MERKRSTVIRPVRTTLAATWSGEARGLLAGREARGEARLARRLQSPPRANRLHSRLNELTRSSLQLLSVDL